MSQDRRPWWEIAIIGALLLASIQAANIVWIMGDDIAARDRAICNDLAAVAKGSNDRAEALKSWLATDIELQSSLSVIAQSRAERLLRERAANDHAALLQEVSTMSLPDCTFADVVKSKRSRPSP